MVINIINLSLTRLAITVNIMCVLSMQELRLTHYSKESVVDLMVLRP